MNAVNSLSKTERLYSPGEVRRRIAMGEVTGTTANLAPEYVQGNLVILPKALAYDFLSFCHGNPKPCPLLGVSEPGDPSLPSLGEIDIRRDISSYNVYRDGILAEQVSDLDALWEGDFVSFVLGCSLSFEESLLAEGIPLRHISKGTIVPMYRTNIKTTPAGLFSGPMVVSMRPMRPEHAIRAVQITTRFPLVHGAPVHLAEPELLGITDLEKPDWGDPPGMQPGEIPVFWACGVTPQAAIEQARPKICITHTPGHMLITDLRNRDLALL